ncbi:hypothetical protein [Mucilaginibacter sp. PAMB04168]|uniref:hypothetical protein n=1 Tax=Mucilaginibacter sp. PAMB04168 TaxID=3138567 RepID=UPI0031F635B6
MTKPCLLLGAAVLLLLSCQAPVAKNQAVYLNDTVNYAYQIKQSDQWRINVNKQNILIALKALKAYESGDTASLKRFIAENLAVFYDGGMYKGPSSEFMYLIKANAQLHKNLRFKIKDWESVVSKDGQQQRVTLRYTQTWITAKGQPDSVDIVNDALFSAGKITTLYDYTRRYRLKHNQ